MTKQFIICKTSTRGDTDRKPHSKAKLKEYTYLDLRNVKTKAEANKHWYPQFEKNCINIQENYLGKYLCGEHPVKHKHWIIELDSLEDLMKLASECPIVIGSVGLMVKERELYTGEIEIYDDYRE